MDEFVYVLIAVAVIFALLFAFSTPLAEIMTDDTGDGGNEMQIASFPGGSVGMLDDNVAKVVNFGTFELGRPQRYDLINYPELAVKSGLLDSNSHRIDVDADIPEIKSSMRALKVEFDLKRTNQLGNLIVRWNGYELFNDIANLNYYELEIPSERIKKNNYLEVLCAGPGWMFWAENSYELENFNVFAEYGPEKIVPFDLTAEELETWNKGRFSFFITGDEDATLLIKLNGDVIYSGEGVGERIEFSVNYTSADMRPGTNLMSFKTTNGIITLHNAKMEIITFGSGGAVLEKNINITQDKYAYLSRYGAYFEINIKDVDKSGTLTVDVNGKRMNVPVSSAGKTTVFVDSSKFILGENVFRFSGTGAFEIDSIRIYTKR